MLTTLPQIAVPYPFSLQIYFESNLCLVTQIKGEIFGCFTDWLEM